MGVTSWLLRHTPPRPLVLTTSGGTGARLAVERYARERGWRLALSPAEANILVIAGEGLEPYATRVWHAIPAPRVRVDVAEGADVPAELAAAAGALRDATEQRKQAQPTDTHPVQVHDHATTSHEAGGPSAQATHDHTAMGHSGHANHDDHDQQAGHAMDHGGHDHHMAGMEMPGGVPMADRAPDRDGLMLDQLHVPLGPALPLWPPGLIVHTRLQGDVIQDTSVELPDNADDYWAPHPVARRLDSCACLLALAGWADAATTAQRLRDAALAGTTPEAPLRKWASRVRRSRTLRWLLTGVGETPSGDALDRLYRWLDPAAQPDDITFDQLPTLLEGTELATARLVIASLGACHG